MKRLALRFVTAAVTLSLIACGSGPAGVGSVPRGSGDSGSGSTPIQHIVIMVQENRSFNNLFAQFPGVTGTITGIKKVGTGKKAKDEPIPLKMVSLEDKQNLNHLYISYQTAYDGGKMDAFNQIIFINTNHKPEGAKPYQYVNPQQIQPYWTIASQWGIANMMFQTQGSGSFTAHQDLIRGGTELTSSESMIDDPTSAEYWGCDSPAGTVTSLITTSGQYEKNQGPLPCTSDFPSSGSYQTLRDTMDTAGVTWKYYVPKLLAYNAAGLWNAFDVIAPVRYGPEWGTNVSMPEKNILTDISSNQLPQVSWVIPDESNSDHPGYAADTGPSWVSQVINAIGGSSYWNSTVVLVLWDDWGGFYDPVAPPTLDQQGGPGFRVPMLVVSPYTKLNASSQPGYISNTVYGFGSIVRYVEDNFGLPYLGTTDVSSNSIVDMLDYNQTPRSFTTIPSKYSRAFFLHQKPSGLPVDTQ